jgi:hypothetical protein
MPWKMAEPMIEKARFAVLARTDKPEDVQS